MSHRTEDHDAFLELAAGHALHALEPEDEQAFLAHVSACAVCERALAEHRETLSHLAYAAADEEPPPAVLEGIRTGVRESGRGSTFGDEVLVGAASLDRARARRGDSPRMRRVATWLGAAAALALVASLAVWNSALQRDQQDVEGTFEALIARVVDEDTEQVPLTSPEDDRVVAVALVDDGEMSLVVDGLEPNDVDSTSYVLWGKNSLGGVRAVGTFDVSSSDPQLLEGMTLEEEMTAFMVTHEKGNTAPPVSTQPVLAVGET